LALAEVEKKITFHDEISMPKPGLLDDHGETHASDLAVSWAKKEAAAYEATIGHFRKVCPGCGSIKSPAMERCGHCHKTTTRKSISLNRYMKALEQLTKKEVSKLGLKYWDQEHEKDSNGENDRCYMSCRLEPCGPKCCFKGSAPAG
jgi:hypothetical protein